MLTNYLLSFFMISCFINFCLCELYAWRNIACEGTSTKNFTGFDCTSTDYRFVSFSVKSNGPPELWMGFKDPNCQEPNGFINPGEECQSRHGHGSVQSMIV
ncbi:unnamed protein product [Cunninghamella echinulata]